MHQSAITCHTDCNSEIYDLCYVHRITELGISFFSCSVLGPVRGRGRGGPRRGGRGGRGRGRGGPRR